MTTTNLAMRHVWAGALGLALPVLVGGAGGSSGTGGESPDPLERNRLLLDKYRRDDIDLYLRLLHDQKVFWELPRDEQEKLRRLDQALHQPGDESSKRLGVVLEHYVRWHTRLSEEDQQRIAAAEGRRRLQVIREIRERQLLKRIPIPDREKLEKLPPNKRRSEINKVRRAERQQRLQWTAPVRFRALRAARMQDLPREVRDFVTAELLPRLTPAEKEQLRSAQAPGGPVSRLTHLLVELHARHPVLPPGPGGPVTGPKALPPPVRRELRDRIDRAGLGPRLAEATGRWPDFALVVAEAFAGADEPLPPLGASRPEEMPAAVRVFVAEKLETALTAAEKARLENARGTWPGYPLLVLELADKHRLVVPEMSLPGPPEVWEGARDGKSGKQGT